MDEKESLLVSIADTIKTYREGELIQPTADHVGRWAKQFSADDQLLFLREFDHVIKRTFLTKEVVKSFLENLVRNEKLAGSDPAAYWAKANILTIQKAGQSQKEMVKLFAETLQKQCGLNLDTCGVEGGEYIYLDDVLFTGGRVVTDLQDWIVTQAPVKAVVNVIVIALHSSGSYYAKDVRLKKIIQNSGKNIKINFWRLVEPKNQKRQKDSSDVLWPVEIPAVPEVQAYVQGEEKFPLALRVAGGSLGMFSSEVGRQILEREFLVAGVKIRSMTQAPKDYIRPLGFGNFGVGFGSIIVTYRNCPNNCPLAIWWGNSQLVPGPLSWYPLLPRKTYS